ncbi:MAG TPA: hypothetical protein DEO70_02155 [Bacteroidales bacterium]|nr:MAG: hypothetical protein A2X11_05930 [Bacteroidetes bacterium GWE2_42_24]OFY28339.1 MAG: hypothetical protein A2X09_14640 [Bacteroidetes bacterium GWF2_43_11]HBY52453.1 hypothetical protein [Marinilabiliales bacterium]HBZ65611.1 hypothetical protein [Bacteroidales bacterium]
MIIRYSYAGVSIALIPVKGGDMVTLRGQRKSTLNNYILRIALFVIRLGKLPEQIDPEEINEYHVALARSPKSSSRSSLSIWFTDCAIKRQDAHHKSIARNTLAKSHHPKPNQCHCLMPF